MDNKAKISAAPVPALPVGATVAEAESVKKSSLAVRLLALLPLVLCVGLLILKVNVFTSAWAVEEQSIALDTLKALFASKEKAFGFLFVFFAGEETIALVANLLVYVLLLSVAISAVLAIVGLISGKSAIVRASLAFVTWGAVFYAVTLYFITGLKLNEAVLDIFVLALAAGGIVFTLFAKLQQLGKAALVWLLHFVLVFASAGVAIVALKDLTTFGGADWVAVIAAALMLVNAIVAFCTSSVGIVRGVIQLILAAVFAVAHFALGVKADMIFAIVAAVIALVHLVIIFILSRKTEEEEEEAVEAIPAEFRKEEYLIAYPYDGGPVAGVELAEEVNPTLASINAANNPDLAAQATVASLLGNGFDPFLITLNEREKEEFIDLYVLKCKGIMPEIPGYVVGGDNKDFFNKVFIYLGQYREKIPGNLLSKMYQFSMKI